MTGSIKIDYYHHLLNQEFVIVSGFAKGLIQMAHEAAIRYKGGKTIGVLGVACFIFIQKKI